MWFKLAAANFSAKNLGKMSDLESSYKVTSEMTGLRITSLSSTKYTNKGDSVAVTGTITVNSGYKFANGSKITNKSGTTIFTATKDYAANESFDFSMNITADVTLLGAATVVSNPTVPTSCTLTINPTPSTATVTLNGVVQKSITVDFGASVTWKVSQTGYASAEGTWVASKNETKNVELVQTGSVVQLTSSNTVFTTTDYHLAAMTSGGPLVTSTQGTKGVMAWDIPAKALVTLTCSPNGNYGMAMTNSDGTVVKETLVNSAVAVGENGTYTFSPVLGASRLYVSTTKFVSASYAILSDEELAQYDFNVMLEFTSDSAEGKYINTTQTVGSDVAFADMGGNRYAISQTIPANSIITLNVKTGGSYGMCIADVNGKVLQNNPSGKADASGNIVFNKQSVPCKLWVSLAKFNKATYKLGG